MKAITYSQARNNLRAEIDEVISTSVSTCIVSRKNQVVIITKAQFDIYQDIINENNGRR